MTRLITTPALFGAAVVLAASFQLAESQAVQVETTPAAADSGSFPGPTLHWGDFDLDGLEDVFAIVGGSGALLHNEGDGSFTDVTDPICLDPRARLRQASWGDFDGDGWLDLLLVKAQGTLELWRSDQGTCFLPATLPGGLGELTGVRSATWLDYDRDGLMDLHLLRSTGHLLLHGGADGLFSVVPAGPELKALRVTSATSFPGIQDLPPTREVLQVGNRQVGGPRIATSGTQAGASGAAPSGPNWSAASSPGTFTTPCSAAVLDSATGICVGASSIPALGLLYPLSSDFNVDVLGDIHFGDGSDRTTVIQQGLSASLVTADAGGKVYVQTGLDLTPGSTARLLFTGMGGTPVHMSIDSDGDVGIGVQNPDARLHIDADAAENLIRGDVAGTTVFEVTDTGRVVTTALEITGGGDLVEGFDTGGEPCEPGTVMIIDPEHPGRLIRSNSAYDTKVAGVVSGAGGVRHGIRMGQDDLLDGDTLLAMTGRVYVHCSAENGAIRPGDRLTTATLPGYAMKVTDSARSVGAVIGKAMSALDEDTGLVLVLVNLQ